VRIRYIGLGLGLAVVLWWLTLALAALVRGRNISKCPRCESTRVRPSWPRFVDNFLFPASIKPYRCEVCKKRFYAMGRKLNWTDHPKRSLGGYARRRSAW